MMWDVQKLLGQLPQPVVTILRQATPTLLEQMTEIRLRSGQPLVVTVGERTLFLSKSGTVVPAEQGFKYRKSWCRRQCFRFVGTRCTG